jgi:hypothetical protein
MMKSLFLDVQLPFATKREAYESEDVLLWFLGVCVRLNVYHLRAHPELPRLYSSGVVYCAPDQMTGPKIRRDKIREAASYLKSIGADDETAAVVIRFLSGNIEIFQDIPTLYRLRRGDCDRLVVARCAELLAAGQIKTDPTRTSNVAFHDPCYLGRHNGETEAPRAALTAGGATLVEMPRNRKASFCCGAGGAQVWKASDRQLAPAPIRQQVRWAP